MSSRKSAGRWSPTVSNLRAKVPSSSPSFARHAWRDIAVIIVVVAVFLGTSSWFPSQDARYIYLSAGMSAAALTYLVSANWLRNTSIVVAAMSLLLMAGEICLGVMEKTGGAASIGATQRETLRYSKPLKSNGGPLGYTPLPNRVVEAWKIIGADRIYDVTYTIDSHALRVTPGIGANMARRGAFLFFGCSFTFGEGLNDDQTLPYYFARELAFAQPVVNLGFSGYGPHQMLKRIESGMLDEVVSGPVQAAVYVALPSHVDRAAGKAWWDPVGPKYELDSRGIARYVGPFTRVPEPLIPVFYKLLQLIEARRSPVLDRVVELVFNDGHADRPLQIRTFSAIVARAAQLLKERYGANLSILYWDDNSQLSAAILNSLAADNLPILKVSDIIPLQNREAYQIPKDWHPTALANQLLARALSKRILVGGSEGVGAAHRPPLSGG